MGTKLLLLYYISAVLKVHRTKFYAHMMMCGSQNRSVSHFEFGIWFFFLCKKNAFAITNGILLSDISVIYMILYVYISHVFVALLFYKLLSYFLFLLCNTTFLMKVVLNFYLLFIAQILTSICVFVCIVFLTMLIGYNNTPNVDL